MLLVVGLFFSRGIHVIASSMFRRKSDDSDTFDVGGKFLHWSAMHVVMLNGYSTGSHLAYIRTWY